MPVTTVANQLRRRLQAHADLLRLDTLNVQGTSKNRLRQPMRALRGARSLAVRLVLSRSLRSVRLALDWLATVFRGSL